MKVLFNQWSTVGPKTGIGHYTYQLMAHLRQMPGVSVDVHPSDVWIATDRRLRSLATRMRIVDTSATQDPQPGTPPKPPIGTLRWAVRRAQGVVRRFHDCWLDRSRRQQFFAAKHDLYHEPNFIPVDSSLTTVTTLHDLSVLLHPQWHPRSRIEWYEKGFPKAIARSSHFIAVSEFTRRQVIQHLGVPADRVTCVHNGTRPEFRPLPDAMVAETLKKLGLPAQYLLYVGTIEPRKNLLRLMQAYCALPDSVRDGCPLVLVGQWGWNVAGEREYYQNEASRRGVRLVGYLDDEVLPAVFNGARALVYPSLYEGFGLPPLEMLACGGAVLGSNIEPIVEVVENHGDLTHPEDVDGWRDAMQRVIVDDDWRRQLQQGAVEAASRFTWKRSAEQTVEAYRVALHGAKAVEHRPTKTAA
jgi:glycosyltransferase involved in cell wall biosynthesis